ncbi:MAG: EamA family transporter [Flavisolibacter sp.]
MLYGYLASVLFILLLATGIYLFGYASRNASPLLVTVLEIISGILLSFILVLLIDNISPAELLTKPAAKNWMWMGASAVTGYVGGTFFTVINLRSGGERINSLLSPAITAFAVAAGAMVFGEVLTVSKITGILTTIAAVTGFLFFRTRTASHQPAARAAFWSGIATVVCITLSILSSIKGTQDSDLSIMHSIWLRLLVALPFLLPALFKRGALSKNTSALKFYGAIVGGVVVQTIFASYLWFYCTYAIGISTFQVIIATLPFFVYAADVWLFRRTKPSLYFLLTALMALAGICLVMWGDIW